MEKKKDIQFEQMLNKSSYMNVITSMLSRLIIPNNLPKELKKDFPFFLIRTLLFGSGFIVSDKNGVLHYTNGSLVEPFDDFGFGTKFITHTIMGNEYKGELNKDGCVIFPYSARRTINVLEKTARHLSELDTSEKFLIRWARVAPIIVADDNKQKETMLEVIKSIMDGCLTPVVSENALSKLLNEKSESFATIDVMKSDRIKDLQYLNEQRQFIIKNISQLFGLPYQTGTKLAQQSVDEVNSGNGLCYVLPLDILGNFETFAENLNETFGLNVSFTLNSLVLHEMEKYFNEVENEHECGENITDELEQSTDSEQEHTGD